ncbi:response regulator transcription factor [Aeromonas bestiarum]|uniref:Response regulator transcription factor n=1 Tax=Aeromonas bestiarum TaxID=105751 RepID=A0ABT7Q3D2_9GAMM|nr:response regulator transcription factor [Aeromonas bestiarum]MDM5073584.1 response regulator transcription factor [Aeromonas bestiarum]
MKKVLIVDDHPAIRVAVRILLQQEKYVIVGEVDNGVDALSAFKKIKPDIIVIDIGIPNLDGIEVIKRIRKENLYTNVIVFSAIDSHHSMVRCMQAGADGFISKLDDITALKKAIPKCVNGIKVFPRQAMQEARHASVIDSDDIFHSLSDREITVLRSLCLGKSNKEIAIDMLLSEKTISTYKTRMMAKLNVSNMVELLELAKKRELF